MLLSIAIVSLGLTSFCPSVVNCLDRHVEANPDKTALIWEKDEPGKEERVSYRYEGRERGRRGGCHTGMKEGRGEGGEGVIQV